MVRIEVYVEKEARTLTLELAEGKTTVLDVLKQLSIAKSTVLCAKNGEVVTEDETLSDQDKLRLYSVISGG